MQRNKGNRAHDSTSPGQSSQGQRIIAGRNCVLEVLRHSPERIITLFASKTDRAEEEGRAAILTAAKERRVEIKTLPFPELTQKAGIDSHQGFIALVKERSFEELKQFIDRTKDADQSLVLLLDSIFDPQNLGAILRAAECHAVDAVIWSKNRGADITPAVSKASVGATELIPIIKVSNLNDALGKLKDAGYWACATSVDEGAENVRFFDWPGRVALMLGSEGEGLQSLLLKQSDFRLYLPMKGRIDSLNVSQAASVFLDAYRRKFP